MISEKVPYKHTSTWPCCLTVLPPDHWSSTDSTVHRGLHNSTPKRQRFMNFSKKIFTKCYFTTSTFNIRWALLNIWMDQMFQVRTVVHCVHSSPVNGTHVTRVVIKTIFNTKRKNFNIKNTKCILLPLLSHTLATSLTPRVTRCHKLGLFCPLYMLCTRQSQTQWSTKAQSSVSFQWEPGHKHNVVNSGGVWLFLPKQYFKWIRTKTYLHNVLFFYHYL